MIWQFWACVALGVIAFAASAFVLSIYVGLEIVGIVVGFSGVAIMVWALTKLAEGMSR